MSLKTAQSFIDQIKGPVVKYIVKQAMGALISKLPFLASGPIGWVVSYFVTMGVEFLAKNTILAVTLQYIDISNGGKVKKVDEATEKIHKAKKEGATSEEIKKLDDELAKAGLDLIEFGHLKP